MRTLGSLLPELEGKYKLFHPSLAEWLTDPWQNSSIYTVNLKEGHQQLAEAGIAEFQLGAERMSRYYLTWLPTHLRLTARWQELEELLEDLRYLEAKTSAGLVFDLAEDFRQAVEVLPESRPQKRILNLLEEAVRRDIHFIHRHRRKYLQGLFQCLWNTCWWYDCPEASKHYEEPENGWPLEAPWKRLGPKLFQLLQRWRTAKAAREPAFHWLRSRRPPAIPLESGQIAIFSGHTKSITSLAVSDDMRFTASGAEDSTVRLWDLRTGHEKWCSATLEGNVLDVTFSLDTRHIAAAVERGYFRVWETKGFQVTHQLHGPGGLSAAVTPGLNAMAFGGYPQTDGGKPLVLFCDIRTGKITRLAIPPEENRAAEPMEQIRSLAFSQDGGRLAVGCTNYLGVWNTNTSQWMWHDLVDNNNSNGIWKVSFCPRGQRLAAILHSRNADGVRILSTENGQELFFVKTSGPAKALAWSADGEHLAIGLDDDSISIFDTASWQCLGTFSGHDEEITSVGFVGPNQVLSGSKDRTLRLWDLRHARQRPVLPDPKTSALFSSGFECDGTKLLASAHDGVEIWDTIAGVKKSTLRVSQHSSFGPKVWLSSSGDLAFSDEPEGGRIWRVADGKELIEFTDFYRDAISIAFSPDSTSIALGTRDGKVRILDQHSQKQRWTAPSHEGEVWPLTFSPNALFLASGDATGTVVLSDTVTGGIIHRFKVGTEQVGDIEFVGKTRLAVFCGRLTVWNLLDGTQLPCPPIATKDYVFSNSGDLVAAAYTPLRKSWGISIFRVSDGSIVQTLPHLPQSPIWMDFTRDDAHLIQSAEAGTQMWHVATGACAGSFVGTLSGARKLISGGPLHFPYWHLIRANELAVYSPMFQQELAAVPGSFKDAATLPSGRGWALISTNHLALYENQFG